MLPIDGLSSEGARGRQQAQRIFRDLLRRAADGAGGVVLVEGEPGIGKSCLLREAVGEAARCGFSLAAGVADQLGQTIPLLALRAALGEPFAGFTADRLDQEVRDAAPAWWIDQIAAHLEQRAALAPVLVCIDDVQWAGPAALAALRTLSRTLHPHPVAWVLARSDVLQPDAACLFDVLEKEGAARIRLAPLDGDAVATLLTDAFGAPPDESLVGLAAEAAGNPSLLAELIGGLRDDGGVRLADGRAVLTSVRLPRRLHRVARQRLDALSPPARHLLVTAAVLGSSFRLEDAAELIGAPAGALLPAVEETMAAGIMTAAENVFSFRHQLLRRAVSDLIPPPGRQALHRQCGHLLLSRGESATAAAGHLLEAARRGDQMSLADLDTAVIQTSGSAPSTAADLALRALELTAAADPGALTRAVAATEALAAAGRLEQAAGIARDTLAKPIPAVMEARLRCALSSVLCSRGQARHAAAEAEMTLARPQLPPSLRDQTTAAQLRALTELHDELAGPAAASVLVNPGQHDRHVVVAALIARAVTRWDSGQIGEALELMRDAARHGAGIRFDARHAQPLLVLAAALVDLRQVGQAEEILNAADSQTTGGVAARVSRLVLRARIHLVNGRPADARAVAQGALIAAESAGAHADAAAAGHILGLIALRGGDVADATRHLAGPAEPAADPGRFERTRRALAQAQLSTARDDVIAAAGHLRQAAADLSSRPGLLLQVPATAAGLVRTALAAGDTELAARLTRAAEAVAAGHPAYPVVTAVAAHSRGLVTADPARLAEAAAQHPDRWARASAAEDLGVLLAREGEQGQAISQLSQAIEGYQSAGAAADAARVRRRLRKLGVRRRHWSQSAARPVAGWESLTETEHRVSELVAQGLNNGQVAARMYLSTSTVAFHLRQIFRKLSIGSRVDLARVVIQRSLPAELSPADSSAQAAYSA